MRFQPAFVRRYTVDNLEMRLVNEVIRGWEARQGKEANRIYVKKRTEVSRGLDIGNIHSEQDIGDCHLKRQMKSSEKIYWRETSCVWQRADLIYKESKSKRVACKECWKHFWDLLRIKWYKDDIKMKMENDKMEGYRKETYGLLEIK